MSKKALEYDPVLKEAMKAIIDVVDQYDIGFVGVLTSKTHTEFARREPEWSVIHTYEGDNSEVRVRIRTTHLPKSVDRDEIISASAHHFMSCRDMCGAFFTFYDKVSSIIEAVVKRNGCTLSHTPPDIQAAYGVHEDLTNKEKN